MAEVKPALHALFDSADRNHDGTISMIEAIKACRTNEAFARALGYDGVVHIRQEDGSRDTFIQAFQEIDTNGDKALDKVEMANFAKLLLRRRAFATHKKLDGLHEAVPPRRMPPPPRRGPSEDATALGTGPSDGDVSPPPRTTASEGGVPGPPRDAPGPGPDPGPTPGPDPDPDDPDAVPAAAAAAAAVAQAQAAAAKAKAKADAEWKLRMAQAALAEAEAEKARHREHVAARKASFQQQARDDNMERHAGHAARRGLAAAAARAEAARRNPPAAPPPHSPKLPRSAGAAFGSAPERLAARDCVPRSVVPGPRHHAHASPRPEVPAASGAFSTKEGALKAARSAAAFLGTEGVDDRAVGTLRAAIAEAETAVLRPKARGAPVASSMGEKGRPGADTVLKLQRGVGGFAACWKRRYVHVERGRMRCFAAADRPKPGAAAQITVPLCTPGSTVKRMTDAVGHKFGQPYGLVVLAKDHDGHARSITLAFSSSNQQEAWIAEISLSIVKRAALPALSLHRAAAKGDRGAVAVALETTAKSGVDDVNSRGSPALHLAIVRACHAMEAAGDYLDEHCGIDAARQAADAVALLLAHGADPAARDALGRTATEVAEQYAKGKLPASMRLLRKLLRSTLYLPGKGDVALVTDPLPHAALSKIVKKHFAPDEYVADRERRIRRARDAGTPVAADVSSSSGNDDDDDSAADSGHLYRKDAPRPSTASATRSAGASTQRAFVTRQAHGRNERTRDLRPQSATAQRTADTRRYERAAQQAADRSAETERSAAYWGKPTTVRRSSGAPRPKPALWATMPPPAIPQSTAYVSLQRPSPRSKTESLRARDTQQAAYSRSATEKAAELKLARAKRPGSAPAARRRDRRQIKDADYAGPRRKAPPRSAQPPPDERGHKSMTNSVAKVLIETWHRRGGTHFEEDPGGRRVQHQVLTTDSDICNVDPALLDERKSAGYSTEGELMAALRVLANAHPDGPPPASMLEQYGPLLVDGPQLDTLLQEWGDKLTATEASELRIAAPRDRLGRLRAAKLVSEINRGTLVPLRDEGMTWNEEDDPVTAKKKLRNKQAQGRFEHELEEKHMFGLGVGMAARKLLAKKSADAEGKGKARLVSSASAVGFFAGTVHRV